MDKILFLGCGSWGAALGLVLSKNGYDVTMWHRKDSIVEKMKDSRKHYLIPSLHFPDNISFTSDAKTAIQNSSTVIISVPSQSIRGLLQKYSNSFKKEQTIVNVSKGIEVDTLMTVSEVINDIMGDQFRRVVTLSGPSHAEEVISDHPTTLVSASTNQDAAYDVQQLFATEYLRTYINNDIRGVELGGSMKNVIAIAAGVCDGIGFGDNTKAALLTRSVSEISKLGVAMGAELKTFQGLSGIGDLIVTCLSQHSRNRKVGQAIAKGQDLETILGEMQMVAEGVKSAKSVHQLSLKYQIEMPICEAVYQLLFKGKDPRQLVTNLMTRELRKEN